MTETTFVSITMEIITEKPNAGGSALVVVCLSGPNGLGFTRRHPPNCRWSTVTLKPGMIGGRVQAVLGAGLVHGARFIRFVAPNTSRTLRFFCYVR